MPPNTVYVGRPTKWGNPFSALAFGREQAIALHRAWITGEITDAQIRAAWLIGQAQQLIERRKAVLATLSELRGKDLACWCATPAPYERDRCHAAVLLELANKVPA